MREKNHKHFSFLINNYSFFNYWNLIKRYKHEKCKDKICN